MKYKSLLSREAFTQQLLDDIAAGKAGAVEKLAAFNEAMDRLRGHDIEQKLFLFNAVCAYKDIPNNDGSQRWSDYVRTGKWGK